MKTFLLFFLSTFLLSCAVDEVSDESASNDSNSNLICKVEEITGSNIKKKVCYTKQQIDANELAKLISEIDADGFNGDTMAGVAKIYFDTGKSFGLSLAIQPEGDVSYYNGNLTWVSKFLFPPPRYCV